MNVKLLVVEYMDRKTQNNYPYKQRRINNVVKSPPCLINRSVENTRYHNYYEK